jgi:hypothetical protein
VKTKSENPLHTNPAMLPGAICVQWAIRGAKRRRYYARFWREGGRLRKQYVRQADVEAVTAACAAWRAQERERRSLRDESLRALWAAMRLLRELNDAQ